MAKLYPPIIEGTIPAFYGTTFVVPFSLNRVTSKKEISRMVVKIKEVATNSIILTTFSTSIDFDTMKATFNCVNDKGDCPLRVSKYYKVQIAFVDSLGVIGYFSDMATTKYSMCPIVYIEDLMTSEVDTSYNYNKKDFVGKYSQFDKDPSEKMYSSHFEFSGEEIESFSTEEIIHDSSKDDNPYEAAESYSLEKIYKTDTILSVAFVVTTVNKMVVKSPSYLLYLQDSFNGNLSGRLAAINDFDNGVIQLYLTKVNNESITTGEMKIFRAQKDSEEWEKVGVVTVKKDGLIWEDHTAAQGVTYKYKIQKDNSFFLYSDEVYSDFEDAFIYDGEKFFKLRYNTKISSLKMNIQEQKIETIGEKYPFIFRNGKLKYTEFPISGLLTYLSDNKENFIQKENPDFFTTDITSENLYYERLFKTEIFKWLSDGKEKFFKSPTEGTYIVRLMGVSLTPVDQVGRLIHNFAATAYEIAECNTANLRKYNLI